MVRFFLPLRTGEIQEATQSMEKVQGFKGEKVLGCNSVNNYLEF